MARLAIVGSRRYPRLELVRQLVHRLKPSTVVVSGGCWGVDRAAVAAAASAGLASEEMPAEWQRFGRSAGFRRNAALVASVDGLIAFWDGRSQGTAHSIALARSRGIWLRVYGPDGRVVEQSVA